MLSEEAVVPLCIVRGRSIGVFSMTDEKGSDDKIVAVHVDDPDYAHYQDVSELPSHRLNEIRRFFLDYKALEGKPVDVAKVRGHAAAGQIVEHAVRLYRERIAPSR